MWLMIAISVFFILVIITTIEAWIMLVAFKIVAKDTPVFSDAFKTCFIALLVTSLIGWGLMESDMGVVLTEFVGICVGIIVFTLAISMFIATGLKQSFYISIVMTIIWWVLRLILMPVLLGMNDTNTPVG